MPLPVQLDKHTGIPLYVQLEEQIRLLIRTGHLKGGEMLPTVRELAVSLGINYNTVARVYRDLQRLGVLELKRGIGTSVSKDLPEMIPASEALTKVEKLVKKLIPHARAAQMDPTSLARFIKIKWKESDNES